jgi:hypothetical protein
MNHTIKGIIIVAAITSILVLGAATSMFPIIQNSFAHKKSADRDTNTNTNSATSDSDSTATAENINNINNTATASNSQEQSACAVAVTCPEGSTTVTPPTATTGTLEITKVCTPSCPSTDFSIRVNDMPEFTLQSGQTQVVTLSPGTFSIGEHIPEGFNVPEFTGDCDGTIRAGQTLHCTITNIPRP